MLETLLRQILELQPGDDLADVAGHRVGRDDGVAQDRREVLGLDDQAGHGAVDPLLRQKLGRQVGVGDGLKDLVASGDPTGDGPDLSRIRSARAAVVDESWRTSPATTWKVVPAAPARAASMRAFSARKLVCWLISPISPMNFSTSSNILDDIVQQIDHAHRLLGQRDDVVDHVHQDFLHRDHDPLDRDAFAVQFHHIGVGDDFLHPPALLTRRVRQDPGSRC